MRAIDSDWLSGSERTSAVEEKRTLLSEQNILMSRWSIFSFKVGCVFRMVVVSILPHAEIGPNDYREDALHFTFAKIII